MRENLTYGLKWQGMETRAAYPLSAPFPDPTWSNSSTTFCSVGLSANEPVWHATVFSKNRDRLLEGAVAEEFFSLIVSQARQKRSQATSISPSTVRWRKRGLGRRVFRRRSPAPLQNCHPLRMAVATRPSTFTSRSVPTRPMSHEPILRRGCLRRRAGPRLTLGSDRGYDTRGLGEQRSTKATP
jgi:hypothetical protein